MIVDYSDSKWHANMPIVPILEFLGAPIPTPLYRSRPNLAYKGNCRVYAYLPDLVPIGLFSCPWGWKTPNFAQFSTFTCSGGATWRQTEKVERGCTTTNLHVSNDIKIVSVLQRHLNEVVSTNYVIQQREGPTNRQTKNSMFLAPPGGA